MGPQDWDFRGWTEKKEEEEEEEKEEKIPDICESIGHILPLSILGKPCYGHWFDNEYLF